MAIGATNQGDMRASARLPGGTVPGSVQSNWVLAHGLLTATAQTSAELLNPASTNSANVYPIEVPFGATRVLLRMRVDDAASANGTPPVVRLLGLDANSLPIRIDNVDSSAAGITLTWTSSDMTDGTDDFSDPSSLTGYDLLGCKTLYVLCETAGVFTGTTDAEAWVLFLN